MTFSEDLGERQWVSQYGTDAIGFRVHKAGELADADGPVTVRGSTLDYASMPLPPAAPAVAVSPSGVLTGTYTYKVTFVTSIGETAGGTTSAAISPVAEKVAVSGIPLGPAGVITRKLYRTEADGASYKLLATISDNFTTSYLDNTADAGLGTTAPVVGPGSLIFMRPALHPATGTYEIILASSETAVPGLYSVSWSYSLDSIPQEYVGLLEVGRAAPAYDALDVGMKGVVESAWIRFADLFDSPYGGPHLQVYFQSRFDRNRMAQLLRVAVGRLNTIAQPHSTYSVDDPSHPFPVSTWGAILEHALYVEAIKHLRRSYVEQPEAVNVSVARQDRRDYMSRWGEILRDEEADLKAELDTFKISNMGLGRPRVLVSGGVFGNFGPQRLPGSAAARPRYWAQWV